MQGQWSGLPFTDAKVFARIDSHGGVVRAGVNTRGTMVAERTAEIADDRLLRKFLQDHPRFQLEQTGGLGAAQFAIAHVNRSIRALVCTQLAADAVIANPDLPIVAPGDRPDRATNHADGIETTATGDWNEVFVKPRAIQIQPVAAVRMGIDARLDTGTAARAFLQVDQHQLLSLHQPQSLKLQGLALQ